MSSAADNSVKQWLFDSPDGSARLLRHRSGHSATPSVVRHYGDGNRLLSAGENCCPYLIILHLSPPHALRSVVSPFGTLTPPPLFPRERV